MWYQSLAVYKTKDVAVPKGCVSGPRSAVEQTQAHVHSPVTQTGGLSERSTANEK
jgi:hypothetical protein